MVGALGAVAVAEPALDEAPLAEERLAGLDRLEPPQPASSTSAGSRK